VLAYRCLVKQDDREAPSFLLESVVNGNQTVRRGRAGAPAQRRRGCRALRAVACAAEREP
jgi:hypothetical protein